MAIHLPRDIVLEIGRQAVHQICVASHCRHRTLRIEKLARFQPQATFDFILLEEAVEHIHAVPFYRKWPVVGSKRSVASSK